MAATLGAPAGRIAAFGATADFHHGPLAYRHLIAAALGWRRDAAPAERGPQRGSRAGGPECRRISTAGC